MHQAADARRPAGPRAAAHRPRTVRADLARPRLPGPCPAGRLPGHRRTRWPGGAGQPAAGPLRRPGPHRRRRRRRCCTTASPPTASPSPRPPRTPVRPPRRVLDLPRYRAMEHRFDRIGPWGRSGMCSTAAVQVCVDAGEGADVARRWDAVHALGPVLVAAFANSPVLHGRRTGWKSSRLAAWLRARPAAHRPAAPHAGRPGGGLGPARARHRAAVRPARDGRWDAPPGVTFADWVRGDAALPGPPTIADLDYHISTLFPPVRPHGHLEVRYVDAQPGRRWALPAAVLAAVLSDAGDHGPGARGLRARAGAVGLRRPARARRPGAAARRRRGVRAGPDRAAAAHAAVVGDRGPDRDPGARRAARAVPRRPRSRPASPGPGPAARRQSRPGPEPRRRHHPPAGPGRTAIPEEARA